MAGWSKLTYTPQNPGKMFMIPKILYWRELRSFRFLVGKTLRINQAVTYLGSNLQTNPIWTKFLKIFLTSCFKSRHSLNDNINLKYSWNNICIVNIWGKKRKLLTATDLTALISFLLSKFFRILLISVKGKLLLYRISLLHIPIRKSSKISWILKDLFYLVVYISFQN